MGRHDGGSRAARPRAGASSGALAVVLTVGLVVAGCGVPIPPEVPDTTVPRGDGGGTVDRLIPVDAGTEDLVAALAAVGAQVAAARELLAAGDAAALGVLLGAAADGDGPGLLPAIDPDRGGTASDDLLTALITLAGDVGGERSRLVLELVRDPMLGDLGAWQRDPVGIVTLLRSTAASAASDGVDPATLDEDILALPGQLTRALGYAFVVAASDDPALVAHAAAQGAGRLGVVLVALELAAERLGAAP